MPSYTPILLIQEVSASQNQKEVTINNGFVDVENATQAAAPVDLSGGNVTLTASQLVGNFNFIGSGQTANVDLVIPLKERFFFVQNTDATYSITVKGATGSTVILPPTSNSLILCDGTNCVAPEAVPVAGGAVASLTSGTSLIALSASTGAVTLTMGTVASGDVLANFSGSTGTVSASTLTALLDLNLGNVEGSIIQRGASAWQTLAPGTSAYVLMTQGSGSLAVWTPQNWNPGTSVSSLGTSLAISSGTINVAGTVSNTVISGGSIINPGTATGFPTPVNASDAVTKAYADAAIQGLQIKSTAQVATTTTLPTYTYLSGVITVTATGVLTIDTYTTALGDYVLVKDETAGNAPNNGLYTVTTAGAVGVSAVLTRATDMNTGTEFAGAFVPVGDAGSANVNTLWLCQATGTVTVGVTNISFTQLNSATSATAGAGISSVSGGTIVAFYQAGSLTSFGTGLTLTAGALTPNWQVTGTISSLAANQLQNSSGTLGIVTGPTIQATLGTLAVIVNTNTGTAIPALAASTALAIVGKDGVTSGPEVISVGGTVTGTSGAATFTQGRLNGSLASPTALGAGDRIASTGIRGYDGTQYATSFSAFDVFALGAWTGTSHSTYQRWQNVLTGSTTATEIMRLSGTVLMVGTTAPVASELLTINGGAVVGTLTVGGSTPFSSFGTAFSVTSGTLNVSGGGGGGAMTLGYNAQTGTTYTIATGDIGKLVVDNNVSSQTITIPAASTIGATNVFFFKNNQGTAVANLVPASGSIDAGASLSVQPFGSVLVLNDGTNYFTFRGYGVQQLFSNGNAVVTGKSQTISATTANTWNFIGGGSGNNISGGTGANYNVITGGVNNSISGSITGGVIAGGQSNSVTGNSGAVLGGTNNTAQGGIAAGQTCTASGSSSFALGQQCVASGNQSVAMGFITTASGSSSIAQGYEINSTGTITNSRGYAAVDRALYLGDFFSVGGPDAANSAAKGGRAQWERHILWNKATAATNVRMTSDGSTAGSVNIANVATWMAGFFTANIIILDETSNNGNTYYMSAPATIFQAGSIAATSISGVTIVAGPTIGSGLTLQQAPTIVADTTHGGFNVNYTPPTSNTDSIYGLVYIDMNVTRIS